MMQDVEPSGGGVGINTPGFPRVRIQIVESYWQGLTRRIICVVADLEIADGALGVVEHGCGVVFVFHSVQQLTLTCNMDCRGQQKFFESAVRPLF